MLFLANLILSIFSGVFLHPIQLHVSSQYLPYVKHSQYILRHLDLEHLQVSFPTVVDFYLIIVSWVSYSIVDYRFRVFLPRPRVLRLDEDGETQLWFALLFRIESFWFTEFWRERFWFFDLAFLSLFLSWVKSLKPPVPSFSTLELKIRVKIILTFGHFYFFREKAFVADRKIALVN